MSGERNRPDVEDLSAFLDGELTPAECAWVEEALANDAELAAQFAEFEETSRMLRALPTLRAPESILSGVRAELPPPRSNLFSSFGSWAALFLVAAVGWVFWFLEPPVDELAPHGGALARQQTETADEAGRFESEDSTAPAENTWSLEKKGRVVPSGEEPAGDIESGTTGSDLDAAPTVASPREGTRRERAGSIEISKLGRDGGSAASVEGPVGGGLPSTEAETDRTAPRTAERSARLGMVLAREAKESATDPLEALREEFDLSLGEAITKFEISIGPPSAEPPAEAMRPRGHRAGDSGRSSAKKSGTRTRSGDLKSEEPRVLTIRIPLPRDITGASLTTLPATLGAELTPPLLTPKQTLERPEQSRGSGRNEKRTPNPTDEMDQPATESSAVESSLQSRIAPDAHPFSGGETRHLSLVAELSSEQVLTSIQTLRRWRSAVSTVASDPIRLGTPNGLVGKSGGSPGVAPPPEESDAESSAAGTPPPTGQSPSGRTGAPQVVRPGNPGLGEEDLDRLRKKSAAQMPIELDGLFFEGDPELLADLLERLFGASETGYTEPNGGPETKERRSSSDDAPSGGSPGSAPIHLRIILEPIGEKENPSDELGTNSRGKL